MGITITEDGKRAVLSGPDGGWCAVAEPQVVQDSHWFEVQILNPGHNNCLILIGWSAPGVPCEDTFNDENKGCVWSLYSGQGFGNSTGHTSPVTGYSDTIVAGTKIGIMLDFNKDGTATLTAYKDGVRAGVMSAGSLRGPLCPAVCFFQTGQSVEFI